jgi:GT2 family glycosyltransferase
MYNNNKRIFIVLPVHNRKDFTRDCLLSLQKQTFQNFTIIVIDDGSLDGTSEMIQKEFPEAVLLRGDSSLWWTGAINLGIKYVLENTTLGGYVLTMNDDTIIQANYLETLLVCASKHQRSLIGSVAIKNNDGMIIEDGGVKINWFTAKFKFLARGNQYKIVVNKEPSVIPVDVLSGRGTLIPVETFHEIGLYDFVRLPHYGADYEFSHRAKKKGYNLFINYKSVVVNKAESKVTDNEHHSFKWKGFLKKLFSKGSPFCIRYRWNFTRLTCPKVLLPSFFLFDIVRIVIGNLRSQIIYK